MAFFQTNKENFSLFETNRWRGQGGGRLGEKGAGGVRKEGEEGVGSGIPKVAGSRRKRVKIRQDCTIFGNPKNAKRQEPGLKGIGSGRMKPPVPPPQMGKKNSKTMMGIPTPFCQFFF